MVLPWFDFVSPTEAIYLCPAFGLVLPGTVVPVLVLFTEYTHYSNPPKKQLHWRHGNRRNNIPLLAAPQFTVQLCLVGVFFVRESTKFSHS